MNALEEFSALGIDFISIHEGVDTSTPNGRLVFGIFASIAVLVGKVRPGSIHVRQLKQLWDRRGQLPKFTRQRWRTSTVR